MKRVADADLRLLRIFATVVEAKGFAVAQAELNLSASSISGYISALEQRLGVRLCSRGRAGFSLTDKGAVIYREAQRLFAALDDFVATAGAARGRLTGTLKVGLVDCTATDPNAPVTRAIKRFNQRDHDVRIELSVGAPASLQRGVLEGRLHLAIGCFPTEISALPAQPLYEEANSFYCGVGHPLFTKRSVTLDDIRGCRVIARSYWRGADLSRLGVEREAAAVDIMEAQATLILSGAYLGYLPEHYAALWLAQGRLKPLMTDQLRYVAPFSMIARPSTAELQVVRQFIEDLCAGAPSIATIRPIVASSRGAARRPGRTAGAAK
ncbi:MAG TPA: LysR family transcriptional regulator [Alphaproteobacteria bacterium]|nr:LysR family transcriptional regulator [Alphaproteobacteria bacterium]